MPHWSRKAATSSDAPPPSIPHDGEGREGREERREEIVEEVNPLEDFAREAGMLRKDSPRRSPKGTRAKARGSRSRSGRRAGPRDEWRGGGGNTSFAKKDEHWGGAWERGRRHADAPGAASWEKNYSWHKSSWSGGSQWDRSAGGGSGKSWSRQQWSQASWGGDSDQPSLYLECAIHGRTRPWDKLIEQRDPQRDKGCFVCRPGEECITVVAPGRAQASARTKEQSGSANGPATGGPRQRSRGRRGGSREHSGCDSRQPFSRDLPPPPACPFPPPWAAPTQMPIPLGYMVQPLMPPPMFDPQLASGNGAKLQSGSTNNSIDMNEL